MKLVTTKITPEALRLLRILRGVTGEPQYQIVERLFQAELARLKKEKRV